MKNLSLVLGVLFFGALGQASPLVCQGYDNQGKLAPAWVQIYFNPSRTTFSAQGKTVVTVQGISYEYKSLYFVGNAQTRCAAGPTLSTDIQDKLSVDLYTWNPCASYPPAAMGKIDYHGSVTIEDSKGSKLTFNVGCKFVDLSSGNPGIGL